MCAYMCIYAYVSTSMLMILVRIYIHMRRRACAADENGTYIQHGGVQWFALSLNGRKPFQEAAPECVSTIYRFCFVVHKFGALQLSSKWFKCPAGTGSHEECHAAQECCHVRGQGVTSEISLVFR